MPTTIKELRKKLRQREAELVRVKFEAREMRSILLRIHSARIGMSESGVIQGLNDIDSFFREPHVN